MGHVKSYDAAFLKKIDYEDVEKMLKTKLDSDIFA